MMNIKFSQLRWGVLPILILMATGFSFSQTKSTAPPSSDELAIRALTKSLAEGWNKGSGAAFAAQFAEDADYVVVNGNYLKGRQQIASGHQQIFDTFYKGTRLWIEIKSVRFLKPDVALMHSVSRVLKPGESETAVRPAALQSFVITKHGGVWLIDSFHNTPLPEPSSSPSK
jgi:uncharacterized protein (TIGR02246 family)